MLAVYKSSFKPNSMKIVKLSAAGGGRQRFFSYTEIVGKI